MFDTNGKHINSLNNFLKPKLNSEYTFFKIVSSDEYFSEYFSGILIVEPRVEVENPNPSEEKIPAEVNQK